MCCAKVCLLFYTPRPNFLLSTRNRRNKYLRDYLISKFSFPLWCKFVLREKNSGRISKNDNHRIVEELSRNIENLIEEGEIRKTNNWIIIEEYLIEYDQRIK